MGSVCRPGSSLLCNAPLSFVVERACEDNFCAHSEALESAHKRLTTQVEGMVAICITPTAWLRLTCMSASYLIDDQDDSAFIRETCIVVHLLTGMGAVAYGGEVVWRNSNRY